MTEALDRSLRAVQQEALAALAALARSEDLPVWYRTFLGRKGRLTEAQATSNT